MSAEFEYVVMQNHARELRETAAEHRRVRQAIKERRGERQHRSLLAKLLSS
jgi:transposase